MKMAKIALFCIGLIPVTNYTGGIQCEHFREVLCTMQTRCRVFLQKMQCYDIPLADQKEIAQSIDQLTVFINILNKASDEDIVDIISSIMPIMYNIAQILSKFGDLDQNTVDVTQKSMHADAAAAGILTTTKATIPVSKIYANH